MTAKNGREYFIVKHDIDSLNALPNYIWNTNTKYSKSKPPPRYRGIKKGHRWIAYAYTNDKTDERLSRITGFFECTKEADYGYIPDGTEKAWMIKGREYQKQPFRAVPVPSIPRLLGRKVFSRQAITTISAQEFLKIQRQVLERKKINTDEHIDAGKIKSIKKILREWIKLNNQYFISTRDAAWWYNERASISILAAAAWAAGGVSLEEFSTRKKGRGQKAKIGRADIFFKIDGKRFSCEAKFLWLRLNAKMPAAQIQKRLDSACDDARKLNPKEGEQLGICFVSVLTPADTAHVNDRLIALQEAISSAHFFDALAWFFPTKARKLGYDKKVWATYSSYSYPGSFIVFKKCG